MIVAVSPVRMVEMSLCHVVGVVAVRHLLVPAGWPMDMPELVGATAMSGGFAGHGSSPFAIVSRSQILGLRTVVSLEGQRWSTWALEAY